MHAFETHILATHLYYSIAPQHAINQVPQRTPEVFAACQAVLVYEEDIMLETRVQMRLQSELNNYRIMMTVDVCVYSV